jgi:UDP-glucose:(heptosyl)LPS alpha-1,3-glucosyltransferase
VRRYGPVGGMERYVWELSRELHRQGHRITVICERCHAELPEGIRVIELGESATRPRWLSLLRFGARAKAWLDANPEPRRLVHSHERLGVHHLTTFHATPFATVFEKGFHRLISIRVWMHLYLERRELRMARDIVPNSPLIKNQLAHYYPEVAAKLTAPVMPGVASGEQREQRTVPASGGIIGFVGAEWQRKGLPHAVQMIAALRQTRPDLELWVAGPPPDEIQHLFDGWRGGYRLLGWRADSDYFRDLDVLLHPARAEPYGMVISEAMAARVPVVVSDACGAAEYVGADSGCVLPLNAPLDAWLNALDRQLLRSDVPPPYQRGWREVAQEYGAIYDDLACGWQ